MPKRARPVDFPSPQTRHRPLPGNPRPERIEEWEQELQRARVCNVRQPWATAIMEFGKTIENRRAPWGPERRWLLISASRGEGTQKQWEEEVKKLVTNVASDDAQPHDERERMTRKIRSMHRWDWKRGGIVGAVLVDGNCDEDSVWRSKDPGTWGWNILKAVEFLNMHPYQGTQSSYLYLKTHPDAHALTRYAAEELAAHEIWESAA